MDSQEGEAAQSRYGAGDSNAFTEPVERDEPLDKLRNESQDDPRDELDDLNELERAVLHVEREWWRIADTREAAIKRETGLTPSRYYVLLSSLLDQPRFWRADPVLVDRLRHGRDSKFDERRGS
ncbi:MAG: DUF3263 domain-containing protein [Arcanobacterium sp.]|nr:DUF3263 domain-containing protein [Arcanobacterium sp.]